MWPFNKIKPTICEECIFYLGIKGQIENCNWQPIFPRFKTDYVTGKETRVEENRANCYERNQGNCKYYKAKSSDYEHFKKMWPPPPATEGPPHVIMNPIEIQIIKENDPIDTRPDGLYVEYKDSETRKTLTEFAKKFTENSIDLDPKITEYLNEHFWELFDVKR